jgi:hypothetical protein
MIFYRHSQEITSTTLPSKTRILVLEEPGGFIRLFVYSCFFIRGWFLLSWDLNAFELF